MRSRSTRRAGFSLLEMVLALAIALVVLAALYAAMSAQFSQAQAGREVLEEGTLARAVLMRIANDVAGQVGALDPRVLPGTASGEEAAAPPADVAAMPFNLGVQGESGRLVLSVSRVRAGGKTSGMPSDLRRITYWMTENGLARQELDRVTGDEADALPPDVADPLKYVIAPEVKGVTFQYFDGSSWLSEWNGTAPGLDGDTPVGPPAAIEVTLKLQFRAVRVGQDEIVRDVDYRHVIALPTANNFAQQSGL